MLTDYNEDLVQRAKRQELLARARQGRLAYIAAGTVKPTNLLKPLHRTACRLHLPLVPAASCALYS